MQISELTALELGREIKEKRISVREAAQDCFERIARLDKTLNCFVTIDEERAMRRADEVQRGIDEGRLTGPLAGVPVAVKDNLCTKGLRTTCGSRMLQNYIPPYSAEAVCRLEAAGGVVLGKTNLDEFAMGSTTETSVFGSTRNPRNTAHVPGGSSGGSAAAVAAGEAPYALGSDTGGSVRQPAAFCGVVGLKPTYGTVSRYGLIAYASSMDQIGPIGKNTADCAAALEVLAARDRKDSTSQHRGTERSYVWGERRIRETFACDFTAALTEDVRGLRIGVLQEALEQAEPGVRGCVWQAALALRDCGASVELFSMERTEYVVPAYYVLACAEASSNLARYDGVKYGYRADAYEDLQELYEKSRTEGFGSEVKRRILLGSFVLSAGQYEAYYQKALQVRARIQQSYDGAFARYDLILMPTVPRTAPRLGESLCDPLQRYPEDCCTAPANLAGLPAISVPCGCTGQNLPVGMQLMADRFHEKVLIRAAYAYERAAARK